MSSLSCGLLVLEIIELLCKGTPPSALRIDNEKYSKCMTNYT